MIFSRRALAAFALSVAVAAPAAAGVLDRMKESGEIRLAVRKDARPMSWTEGGAAFGYTVSICQEVARRVAKEAGVESLKLTYVPVDVGERFDAVAEGRADLLCGAATITLARREKVDFSIPTFVDGASVLLPAGGPEEFEGLAGKRIGVLGGTTTEEGLRKTLADTGMKAEVVTVETHPEGVEKLAAGDIDAYFGDQSILFFLLASAPVPEALRIGVNTLTVEPQALALPLGDTAFRREVDRALSHMYRGGEMLDIFAKSFPGAQPGLGMKALVLVAPQPD